MTTNFRSEKTAKMKTTSRITCFGWIILLVSYVSGLVANFSSDKYAFVKYSNNTVSTKQNKSQKENK
jgi:Ca2+/H+ antiporter